MTEPSLPCAQCGELTRMVREIHGLIFGDNQHVEDLGLRATVAEHKRIITNVKRTLAWVVGALATVATAFVVSLIDKH